MKSTPIIAVGIAIILTGTIFLKKHALLFVGLGLIIMLMPFLLSYLLGVKKEKEIELRFLEFMRELSESVKAGTPITKSIIAISNKDFGSLTPHVKKLANQLSFSIPLKVALRNFARETKNDLISRTIELIIQAETSGGEIASSLDAAVKSIAEIEKIKKERKSQTYGMVIQGYIIFIIFIAIMLFVHLKFFPLISQSTQQVSLATMKMIRQTFFYLLLIQAFFAGLVIGKLSEGSVKYGIKHSAILMIISYLLLTVFGLL